MVRWERVEKYLAELGVPTCGHDGQIQKIKSDKVLAKGAKNFPLPTNGGTQEVVLSKGTSNLRLPTNGGNQDVIALKLDEVLKEGCRKFPAGVFAPHYDCVQDLTAKNVHHEHEKGGGNVTIEELEERVAELRSHPLLIVCKTPGGGEKLMSLEECSRTGSRYIHIAADCLDALLDRELGVK